MGDVHHNLIHGDTAEHRAVVAIQVDTCAGVGKVMQVTIPEANADSGHLRGAVGNVGVIVGDAMITGQGAQQGYAAVKRERVAQLLVVR